MSVFYYVFTKLGHLDNGVLAIGLSDRYDMVLSYESLFVEAILNNLLFSK
jgi:hypothetical protein